MNNITAACLLLASIPASAQWPGAYGPPAGGPMGGLAGPGAGFGSAGLVIHTSQSQDGYYLTIPNNGNASETIEVNISGNTVTVRRVSGGGPATSLSDSYAGPNGHGYSYSYSSSSSQASRRLTLPPDADPAGAVRADNEQEIVVFIPRRAQSSQ